MAQLTPEGKEEVALALLLLKDFKCNGRFDIEVTKQILGLAKHLGVEKEFEAMLSKVPPMRISER